LQFIQTKVLPGAGLDFRGVDTEMDVGAASALVAAAVAAATLEAALELSAAAGELVPAEALLLLDELQADIARLTLAAPIATVATTPVDLLALPDLLGLPIILHSSLRSVTGYVRGL
jgi:hypothetical protein